MEACLAVKTDIWKSALSSCFEAHSVGAEVVCDGCLIMATNKESDVPISDSLQLKQSTSAGL